MIFKETSIKRILSECEKHNIMIVMGTLEEARRAAYQFAEAAGDRVKRVSNEFTLITKKEGLIYFKSVGQIRRGLGGYRARVIIDIPVLECVSVECGGMCTMKQFWTEQ